MGRIGRRIITGNDAKGRSCAVLVEAPRMRGIATELWRSGMLPTTTDEGKIAPLEPPAGGSLFRFFRVMPEGALSSMTPEERESIYAHHFAQMGAAHCRPDTSRHPGMHRTATIDYIMLLDGNVTLVLDDEEIVLEPFDVVVQRGTNHAWVNHGETPALMMAVLIDDSAPSDG